jgi:hypothetical protein
MSKYITADKVTSPMKRWSLVRVLESGDQEDSSDQRVAIALGTWEGDPVLGMRWNGSEDHPIGSPQSRGLPTWFIIPRRLEDSVLATLSQDEQKIARSILNK